MRRESTAVSIKLSAKEPVMEGQEIISEPSGDGSGCLPLFAGRQMLAIAMLLACEIDLT